MSGWGISALTDRVQIAFTHHSISEILFSRAFTVTSLQTESQNLQEE